MRHTPSWRTAYDTNYNGPPISHSLPIREGEFDRKLVYAFFENLLPEYKLLYFIGKQRKFTVNDLFSALYALGRETAGALTITDEENPPVDDGLYEDKTECILDQIPKNEGYICLATKSKISLAGAQDKLPVCVKNDRFLLPVNYASTTHILKPDSLEFKELVYNEHFCLKLTKNLRLNTINSKIYTFDNCRPFLCVERYDLEFPPTVLYCGQKKNCSFCLDSFPSS